MEKTKLEGRIGAYKLLKRLKEKGYLRKERIKKIRQKFNIPYHTLYTWDKYNKSPYGKRKIIHRKELLYVIGSLLGDGCPYYWKNGRIFMVIISGEKEFIEKYSYKLSKCTGKRIKGYFDISKNVWNLKTCNAELYFLFKEIRENLRDLPKILKNGNYFENSLEFIEGFFDAEGCVKVIKEKVRKTPKICLDICCTNYEILELIRKLLKRHLSINARYSIQKPKTHWRGHNKKTIYHLRIYKKEFIRKFFENIHTIKLKPEKVFYVENWLNNGR